MTAAHKINYDQMHAAVKANGGASRNTTTNAEPKEGYMVSIPGLERQVRSQNFAPAHLKEFVERHGDVLRESDRYLGAWDNEGEVSIDASDNVRPNSKVIGQYGRDVASADARTSTMDLMISRNQESAYDVERDDLLWNPDFDASGRRGNAS